MPHLGVDFGTTNSVVAVATDDGALHSARIAVSAATVETIRSVLCFWSDGGALRHAIGPAAVERYLDDPGECRLIMSMKTYLAQRSFSETRVFGQAFGLERLVGLFLAALLPGAGPAAGRITAGRPVRFAGERPDDELGERRLRAGFAHAGWPGIDVALEPEAAGYRFARTLGAAATVLVGDFGGGTSDFSVLRFDAPGAGDAGGPAGRVTALGSAGVGIAGDSFDARIMERLVAPRLGRGGTYAVMGQDLPVPPEYYAGFSRWHRLSMMRTPRTLREIREVARQAAHPGRLLALARLIEDEAGYGLYGAVASAKAELSRAGAAILRFRHEDFAIEQEITRAEFEEWIAPDLARLSATVDQALARSGVAAEAVDRVFLTGGTALMPAIRRLFEGRFGADRVSGGGEFVSVAEGLALIGQARSHGGGERG